MNKISIYSWLLLFFSFQVQAQEVNTIFGTIIVDSSESPLAFVSVVINDDQSSAITIGALTDEAGYFEISGLPVGDHTMSFSLAGFSPQSRNILLFDGNNNYDLGTKHIKTTDLPQDSSGKMNNTKFIINHWK